jgi:type I restriction enzyme, S subunit
MRRVIERLDQGWSPNALPWPAIDDEWGVLKLNAARQGIFVPLESKALDDEPVDFPVVTPQAGDLLVSRSNTPERVGDVCLVPCDHPRLLVPDLLFRVKLDLTQAEPAYACFFLLSRVGRAQIEMDARGSSGSMVKLGQDHVRSWRIPCPPVPEQRAIADYLDRETAKIDQMVAKVETVIDRLQEYRAALITAAVTGKIDVRTLSDGSHNGNNTA